MERVPLTTGQPLLQEHAVIFFSPGALELPLQMGPVVRDSFDHQAPRKHRDHGPPNMLGDIFSSQFATHAAQVSDVQQCHKFGQFNE